MKSLVYEGPRAMRIRDIEPPSVGIGQSLIRVEYSGICGSELSGYLGQSSIRTAPLVFGHELAGILVTTSDDSGQFAPGDRVTANPLTWCGHCRYCLDGRQHLCSQRALLGAHVPGSNAEFVVVATSSLHAVPAELPLAQAATAEPAACAVHAVGLAGATPDQSALIIGAGPVGLFILQILRLRGLRNIVVVETNDDRRSWAESFGAAQVFSGLSGADDAGAAAHLRDQEFDLAFDAAGTAETRRLCVELVSPGGKVMLIGLHTNETEFAINDVVRAEISLNGVFAYRALDFTAALALLSNRSIGLGDAVIEADWTDGDAWYKRLTSGDGTAKVVLRFGSGETHPL